MLIKVCELSVGEPETLPAGTKPGASHHLSPGGGERLRKRALHDLPWRDERGPSSIRWTLELFERKRWGNDRRARAHIMGFSERIDAILIWTERSSQDPDQKWVKCQRMYVYSTKDSIELSSLIHINSWFSQVSFVLRWHFVVDRTLKSSC